jgi:hypothetical protein
MKKRLIATALLFTALPFTFDDDMPTVSKAHAIIGRPLTPMSVAGVHRRAMRRTYGVGANVGYHPIARAAAVGAVAAGAGYYGARYGAWGGGYGYGAPSYAGVGWGGGWGGYHPVARTALYGAAAGAPPLYNAAAAPTPAGGDFALIQFANARCEVWQNSADNPWGTDWTKLMVGIPDRNSAEAVYQSARAQGVCH